MITTFLVLMWASRSTKDRIKRSVLFCSVLLCSVLFCSVLFCSVLFCSVLFCSVLFCSVLFCSVLFCSVLFCSVLFCSVLFCSVLFCSDRNCKMRIYDSFFLSNFNYCPLIYSMQNRRNDKKIETLNKRMLRIVCKIEVRCDNVTEFCSPEKWPACAYVRRFFSRKKT